MIQDSNLGYGLNRKEKGRKQRRKRGEFGKKSYNNDWFYWGRLERV